MKFIPLIVVLVAACTFQADGAQPVGDPVAVLTPPTSSTDEGPALLPAAQANAPVPEEGKASISGTLFSHTSASVIAGTLYYLTPANVLGAEDAPVLLIGPQVERGDITGFSGNDGQFELSAIPPGRYLLAVWAPYSWSVAQRSPEDQGPLILELESGERLALGIVYVPWP